MRFLVARFVTAILVVPIGIAHASDCDIAIINGRVMDPETNLDGVRNVCVKDGRITKITEDKLSGKETIEAKGHVVAPGFIDTHHHGAGNLWGVKASLRDGVTTPLDLELGVINVDAYYAERYGKWPAILRPLAAWYRKVLHRTVLPQNDGAKQLRNPGAATGEYLASIHNVRRRIT